MVRFNNAPDAIEKKVGKEATAVISHEQSNKFCIIFKHLFIYSRNNSVYFSTYYWHFNIMNSH